MQGSQEVTRMHKATREEATQEAKGRRGDKRNKPQRGMKPSRLLEM